MPVNLAQRNNDSSAGTQYGSEALTHDIRVRVVPVFMPEHSAPADRKFIFAYRIRIVNEGERRVRLVSRRWVIVDAFGRTEEVCGEGVVGQQPVLDPGEAFEYTSHCRLNTEWGTMEGMYRMHAEGVEPFDVAINRFYLVARAVPPAEVHSAG